MARIYSTHADLVAYLPDGASAPAEPEATRLLTRASEQVDLLTVTSIYEVDEQDMPTADAVVTAFRDATCAQAAWWLETGDETGAATGQWQSVTAGRISLQRSAKGASAQAQASTVAPQAVMHLRLAGLLPGVIIHS